MTLARQLLVAVLVLLGVAGSVVPVLPGTILILLAATIEAAATGFDPIGLGRLAILAAFTALAYSLDAVAGALGAKRLGGTRWGVAGAFVGALVGFFFGLPGILLGPIFGAFAGELLKSRDLRHGLRSGAGTLLGMLVGAVAKLAISTTMAALLIYWIWRG